VSLVLKGLFEVRQTMMVAKIVRLVHLQSQMDQKVANVVVQANIPHLLVQCIAMIVRRI